MPLTLTGINRYPVKSGRGEALTWAEVEPWGLAGDRRWMVVDADGEAITAREVNALLAVEPQLTDVGVRLRGPGLPDLAVRAPTAAPIPVTVHHHPVSGTPAGAAADRWVSQALGRPGRLVYLRDPTRRPVPEPVGRPGDRVSFADAHPLHLVTEASVAALNDLIAAGPLSGQQPPMTTTRFRPNLVIGGTDAWAEDRWRRIRIGAAAFRVAKGCERCVLPTIDPDTLVRTKEPTASLARHRRWDRAVWFGIDLIPDQPGTPIRLGDEVTVLDAADDADGPLRPAPTD